MGGVPVRRCRRPKSVLTVEWQAREYDHPLMRTQGASDFDEATREGGRFAGSFDVAIALSAFDHDGLGRYGDRLHPDGDLLAMRVAWRTLCPETGRLLLSAPIGPDLVVWNVHRRYGPLRLPWLLGGWDEVARIGFDEERLATPADHKRRFEPLFVLRRNSSADLPVDVQQCDALKYRTCLDYLTSRRLDARLRRTIGKTVDLSSSC